MNFTKLNLLLAGTTVSVSNKHRNKFVIEFDEKLKEEGLQSGVDYMRVPLSKITYFVWLKD